MRLAALAILFCAAVSLHAGTARSADARDYPAKPVRIIVSLSPGSGADIATRTIAAKLSESLGQQFIVDNRVGFSGNIGAETVARAAPDGYTLLVIFAGNAISQSYHPNLAFRLDKNFSAIGQFASVPLVLVVHPSLGVKSLGDFIALARARPKHYLYATPGNGSLPHLSARLLELRAGIDLLHVPYKSTATAVSELAGGQTVATFAAIPTALPLIESGRVRLLGISTAKRSALVPEWPTLSESGLREFDVSQWYGVVAPSATPRAVVDRLGRELANIVRAPDMREALIKRGIDPVASTPEAFAAHVRAEIDKWANVVKGLRE